MLPLSREVKCTFKKNVFYQKVMYLERYYYSSRVNCNSEPVGTQLHHFSKYIYAYFQGFIFILYVPGNQNEIHPAMTEKYLLTTRSQVIAEFLIRFSKCSGSEQRPVKTGTNPVKPDKIQQPITAIITRRCVTLSAYCRGRSTTAMQRSTDMQPKCKIEVVHNVTSMA